MNNGERGVSPWAILLGAAAVGGAVWAFTRKKAEAPKTAAETSGTNALAGAGAGLIGVSDPPPPVALVPAQGTSASFADGSTPALPTFPWAAFPDLSSVSSVITGTLGPNDDDDPPSFAAAPEDKIARGPMYGVDPHHPSGYALTDNGRQWLLSDPVRTYLIDTPSSADAVFFTMTRPDRSTAQKAAKPLNAASTILSTVDGGKTAVFFRQTDLDELRKPVPIGQPYPNPDSMLFAIVLLKDVDAWLASKNGQTFNVRVRATNEASAPTFVEGKSFYEQASITPYGRKLIENALKTRPRYVSDKVETDADNPDAVIRRFTSSAANASKTRAEDFLRNAEAESDLRFNRDALQKLAEGSEKGTGYDKIGQIAVAPKSVEYKDRLSYRALLV